MDFEQYLKNELENDIALQNEFNALQPEYEIIRKLIETRIKYGLTQKELAKKCGIKQSNISRLESGKANPTIKFLQKIAQALDADLFIEFRKKASSSETVAVQETPASTTTTFVFVGLNCPISKIHSSSKDIKTISQHLIKASV
ncbi:MAG: helix-turn-helix transcriptional regulator [Clostridia bacterium]|nr:helix-turn-helix transcriptional regulator [Clostridia bacterium]